VGREKTVWSHSDHDLVQIENYLPAQQRHLLLQYTMDRSNHSNIGDRHEKIPEAPHDQAWPFFKTTIACESPHAILEMSCPVRQG
jgi:hypothetical protein